MDPIINIAHFYNVVSIDMMLQKWAIFIMGVYEENLLSLSDQADFFPGYINNVDTHHESFS